MKRGHIHRVGRVVAGVVIMAGTAMGAGAALTVASAVGQTTSAGADTPDYNITCTNVPNFGTVEFPADITGSIPTDIGNGSSFSLSGYQWNVTIPASITTEINTDYGPNAVVSATFGASLDASGATPASQSETLNLPDVTVPASGPFTMVGTPTSPPSLTGTGASVSITPGASLSGFQITVNGGGTPTFGCTNPTPAPVIAFAQGSSGPYAFVTDPGPNTIAPIDLATGTEGTPFNFGDFEPGAIAVTPNGATAYVVSVPADSPAEITPIATATDKVGTPINTDGIGVDGLAISPDGTTAYVLSSGTDSVVSLNLDTQVLGAQIGVGSDPTSVAFTPDGSKAYVVNSGDDTVTPIDVATNTAGTPIAVGSGPQSIAITPNGSTAYVVSAGDDRVTPINTATNTAGTPIGVGTEPWAIAITPNGSTAYVTNEADDTVTPITIAGNTAGSPIPVGAGPISISVSPDGTTAYAVNEGSNSVTPINTATNTAEAPIGAGGDPVAIAITPDQGPAAALTSSVSGATASFSAEPSVPGTSPIVSYAWDFGDGNTATTSIPATSHTYAGNGTYTTTVTETDAAGASTTQVFTGQTVSLEGSSAAEASASVVIATTNCGSQTSCTLATTVPATPQTPAQSIDVTAAAPGNPSQELDVTAGPAQLECTSKDFDAVTEVTSYDTTFTPTANVTVTDMVPGSTSTHGVKVCFEGSNGMPAYLRKCAKNSPVAPCATVAKVVGGVEATILVAPGDPRFRIDGIGALTETPKSISTKGVIGKTVEISGTDLLGSNGQTHPQVGFTSVNGSTVSAAIATITAKQIVVAVPNGAATGVVYVAWPNETVVSDGPITIK